LKTILKNVNIIKVDKKEILRGYDLCMEDGKIVDLYPSAADTVSDTYIMPAFADSHVHLICEDNLNWYLSYGVTTVYNMMGMPSHLRWQQEIRQGKRLGPEIITSGPVIDGTPAYLVSVANEASRQRLAADAAYPDVLYCNGIAVADTPEKGRKAVRYTKDAGYQFVKIYNNLEKDVYRAVCEEAEKQGILVTGHLPDSCNPDIVETSEAEVLQNVVEHITFISDELMNILMKNRSALSPTLAAEKIIFNKLTEEAFYQEALEATNPLIREQWKRSMQKHQEAAIAARPFRKYAPPKRRSLKEDYRLLKKLEELGAVLMTGTDGGLEGIIPGVSLHIEIDAMKEAGLDSWTILEALTINPEKVYGLSTGKGVIEKDAPVDFLVLKRNPAEEIEALHDIEGLYYGKQFFDKGQLLELRKKGKEKENLEFNG